MQGVATRYRETFGKGGLLAGCLEAARASGGT